MKISNWQINECATRGIDHLVLILVQKKGFFIDQKRITQIKRFDNVIVACQKWIELDKKKKLTEDIKCRNVHSIIYSNVRENLFKNIYQYSQNLSDI